MLISEPVAASISAGRRPTKNEGRRVLLLRPFSLRFALNLSVLALLPAPLTAFGDFSMRK